MGTLRKTTNLKEIQSCIGDSVFNATRITFWQNIDGYRHIWHGRVLSVNEKKNKVIFLLDEPIYETDISSQFNLYIKSEYDELLLKTKVKYVAKGVVHADIPEYGYLWEQREHERFEFINNDTNIYFSKNEKGFNNRSRFTCNAIDISKRGMGLVMQPNIVQNWSCQDVVSIYKVSNKILSEPIEAEIVYIKQFQVKLGKVTKIRYRIGLKFKSEMNKTQMSCISNATDLMVH